MQWCHPLKALCPNETQEPSDFKSTPLSRKPYNVLECEIAFLFDSRRIQKCIRHFCDILYSISIPKGLFGIEWYLGARMGIGFEGMENVA